MADRARFGRPPNSVASDGAMEKIAFRIDAETKVALLEREAELKKELGDVRGLRSILLRRLILGVPIESK